MTKPRVSDATGATMMAVALMALGWASTRSVRAADEVARRLIYASYDDDEAAAETFKGLRAAEGRGVIKLEAYALIGKDLTGKVKVREQRQAVTRAGVAVEAVVALLGGPPGMAVAGAGGSAVGYLTGSGVGMSRETLDRLRASVRPGDAALVVGVEGRWASVTEHLQERNADQIMTHPIPDVQ